MLLATLIFAQAAAASLGITVQAPARVASCEAFTVTVRVATAGRVAPLVSHPAFEPFTLIRRSARPVVTFSADGDPTITVEHQYVLTAERLGTFTIPPFAAELAGVVTRSRAVTVSVQATPGSGTPAIVARAPIDPARDMNFIAMATPDTVFVGEQVQYEVAVFFDERVRERLRRGPTFYPPDMPGFLAYDLPPARGESTRRRVDGRCFDALVYQRAVFPLQAGRTVIPPAQLVYALPLSLGIFNREETHELRTAPVAIVAIEPPAEGRPAADLGAVGRFDVAARIDATAGRVGDPLTLTVRVAGEGNVKLLPRPQLSVSWASLVPDAERVTVDSLATRVRGSKEFDWLLTPRVGGGQMVPPIAYPHFDPAARRYVIARTQALALEIEPAALAHVDTAVAAPRLTLRAHYRGPLGAPLHAHPATWLLALAAPLPAIAGVVRRRAQRPVRVVSPAQQLQAVAGGHADPRTVRRAFVAALADRLQLAPGAFTTPGALERALRRAGVTRELAQEAERVLRTLDAAAFDGATASAFDGAAGARTAGRIYAEVDAEALARWELGRGTMALLVVTLGLAVAASAVAAPADDLMDFRRASSAYEAGDFAAAASAFHELALREPRAPDAWANHGTAAWAAADTAAAAVGWQRALRLEPTATDMRARLDGLRFEAPGTAGYVPPVGMTPLVVTALACWLLAWGVAFRAPARGSPLRAVGATALAAALLLAGGAVVVDERLAADDLVVLRHGGLLSQSPAIGARRDARAETAEVGVTGGREGGWTFVRFDGARAGWVPSSELTSIARAPLRAAR